MVDVGEADADLLGALPWRGSRRSSPERLRALAARAAETYVLASSEKIGTASPYRVLPWGQITGVITDADPTDEVIKQLSALDVEILHADGMF